ncbi:MAG TPA: MmcQ/YjbR family DNA-binding protein [Micromonosporaceae bacterium]|nr:MmcQ/YjbR family DNA-binding protein [Micromonosporaceae bacterium]
MPVTIDQVRKMALALPETTEVIAWEVDLTWRVNNKIFAMAGPDSPRVSLKCTRDDQAELVAMDPETYRVAAYVGRFGWVEVTLARIDADELRELIVDSWRQIAPKRLVKAFDAAS